MADARRYFEAYAAAVEAVGKAAGERVGFDRPGISVKLSALHPRYEAVKRDRVMTELVATLHQLARAAMKHDLHLTIDAEEADRLEMSLDVFAAIYCDPVFRDWGGFGLAVQAYQKRATDVVDWLVSLASSGRHGRLMVRLVKGAYWDTEIKRAQERGLGDYPVFTRKAATDISYLACARRLLAARGPIYPQFAGHNALTVANVLEMAGNADGFELQRLHGMGASLFDAVKSGEEKIDCRVYAPVGGYRDLMAYLVRRLLENGANSSFVARVGDRSLPANVLLKRPEDILEGGVRPRHSRIPLPPDLYQPARRNSRGMEFGHRRDLEKLLAGIDAAGDAPIAANPIPSTPGGRGVRPMVSPIDGKSNIGNVIETPVESIDEIMTTATDGFQKWSRHSAADRAAVLERLSDLLEQERDGLVSLLAREGGKTLVDGIAEVREAVDFCRYYASQAPLLFQPEVMPGPTGERDVLQRRGRGLVVCISPWNFPLAIFLGQVVAALVAGNAVVAKPAEQTPLVAFKAFELLHRSGVPAAAAQLALGDGAIGAALVAHPAVAGVAFTGSTETAWAINRTLARKDGPIVPFIAETGGINAMIVDATALPEQVADDVIASAFRSAGQRCSALRLLCLQDDVADPILEMVTGAAAELKLGDPRDPATDIGPVIDDEAKAALEAHVTAMRDHARIRFAGEAPSAGTFVAPHIVELADAADLTREVFGPILHVVRWRADALDDLVGRIAATGYGLTLGIHSRIDETAEQVVERLPVGNVYVNRNIIGAVVGTQPFGGSGLSGTGPKAGGPDYLRRFSFEQSVSTNTAAVGGNASLIAMKDE
jgi:RHH-type proline utilization regulon transcriptional repressor/proline dehydrogenase/delta 1-pyrroline-5-carboxylate dehydrogenase